ncbi:MAG TPA: peptidoglycan DD-metalloendopeptidase family protein [Vicinamibacterales bacterium]|nr:peptidoglycan DD-metalloendopeptidase family protein [Vicinamibacterales bacterium]
MPARRLRLLQPVFLLFLAASAGAQAPDKVAQAQAKRAAERIRVLQREADSLAATARTLLAELRKLELDRQIRAEEVAKAQADLELATAELATTETEVSRLNGAIERQRPVIASRLADVYRLGRPGYWRLLLDVDDLQSVGRAYRTMSAIAQLDRARVDEFRGTLKALADTQKTLAARAETAKQTRATAQAARAALDRAVAAQSARLREIDARRDLNAQLTGELQDAARKLQSSVAGLGTKSGTDAALPLAPFRGDLPWPAAGVVRSAFGRSPTSRFGTVVQRNGILIAAAEGTSARAVHEGRVAYADLFTGFGNLVIVEHGEGDYSIYGHLRSVGVKRGDTVQRLAVLGETGVSPSGTAGLYFELRVDGRAVDPLQWLKKP